MRFRMTDRRVAPGITPGWARAGLIALRSCLAAMAAFGSGCVVTPRQPASSGVSLPPQVPEKATGAEAVDQKQPAGPTTDFRATATDRQRFQVHLDFGRVFETQGNFEAAVLEYQDAITVVEASKRGRFQPADSALAHRRMGGALDRLGRFAQAELHYKKAIKFSPKDAMVWNDAGYSYYLQGRWADAERALNTAAKLAPDDERIRINLGLTLAAAGKPEQALPLLSQAKGDAIGHANLGYLLAATGQLDLARRQYETALALRPDLDLARRALARLDRQQRDGNQPGAAPALPEEGTHIKAAPVDAAVKQVSGSRATMPPPLLRSIPPGVEAPAVSVDPPGSRTAPADVVDLSKLPPAPPL
jgi:Flp pilus assembly protein TadD